jgi:hypothetical protein
MSHGATKWTISTVFQHAPTPLTVMLAQPNPILFLTYSLSLDPPTRSKQINKALNTFIVRMELIIYHQLMDEVTDNVYWGIFSPNTTPKRS